MPVMVLMGGERDGAEIKGVFEDDLPEIYFAVPTLDEEKIKAIQGKVFRSKLRDQLAVLAYEFDPEHSTPTRFRMKRNPELDRVRR